MLIEERKRWQCLNTTINITPQTLPHPSYNTRNRYKALIIHSGWILDLLPFIYNCRHLACPLPPSNPILTENRQNNHFHFVQIARNPSLRFKNQSDTRYLQYITHDALQYHNRVDVICNGLVFTPFYSPSDGDNDVKPSMGSVKCKSFSPNRAVEVTEPESMIQ